MSLQARETARKEIRRFHVKTGLAMETLLKHAGISKSTWHEWEKRRGIETAHADNIPKRYYLTPSEVQAIIAYCLENPLKGYRALCWEMVDQNIAYVSPSSVYNVIQRHNVMKKWAETAEMKKTGFDQPCAVHEQWHIDFSYVKITGSFYYFLGLLEGFSRRMLAWRLCKTMEGVNAEVLVTEAKELYPEAKNPRIISDNGSQFVSRDFEELLAYLEFGHTLTSANHPQSNGKLERFHRTLKTEHVRRAAYVSYEDACKRLAEWIAYYNEKRLHGAIGYLTPDDVFYGRAAERLAERREKLHTAYINRQEYWRSCHGPVPCTPYMPV